MNIASLISMVATLALLLAAGFVAGKTKITDEVSTERLSTLIVKLGQPFLIINALISQEFSRENLITGLKILLLGICMHAGMAAVAYFLARPIKDFDERKLSEYSMFFANCGFIGFPIVESLYGKEGLFYGAFYIISFHLFVWTWGIVLLARGRSDIRITPKKIILNYGTLPCAIGFILFCLNLPLPSFFTSFVSYLSSICTPIAIIITGANLARRSMKAMLLNKNVYYVCLVKLVVMPVLAIIVLRLLSLPDYMVIFGGIMAAMPCPAVVTMFGEMYRISPGYAAELVGSSTLFCVLTIAPVVMFAQWICTI
ncbi:MAG: AEC family transporter [Eubacteriales bacterium]